MREVLDDLLRWWRAGEVVGVGTVVRTFSSAPRPPGASMLVGPDGTVAGSVSGGCVEGAVYDAAELVADGAGPHLQRYGVSDGDAFAVGLTCGGIIDVFVQRVDRESFPEMESLARSIMDGEPVAVATVIGGPSASLGRHIVVRAESVEGSLGTLRLDAAVRDDARGLLAAGRTSVLLYGEDGQRRGETLEVFVASYAAQPRMLVFGAIDFASAVARVGSFIGYEVTVCDARQVFTTPERFPSAREVIVDWPHRYLQQQIEACRIDARTVICVLTHDPKFDIPLLDIALRLTGDGAPAFIGAMGSRRTHADRLERLRERGLTAAECARLTSPIGLDIGARTPEETAVSIAAEIVARLWGGGGQPLSTTAGPIHGEHASEAAPTVAMRTVVAAAEPTQSRPRGLLGKI